MAAGREGGMATPTGKMLWRHMWEYKDHSKSWVPLIHANIPQAFAGCVIPSARTGT